MPPALPFGKILLDQPQVSLVDQRSRLQRVIRTLPAQVAVSQLVKLLVYDRHQLGERGLFASASTKQKLRDFMGRRMHYFHILKSEATVVWAYSNLGFGDS